MRLGIAKALSAAAVVLLVIYGADVGAAQAGAGFLPLDESQRGVGLGVSSLVLPLAAFAVSWGQRSSGVAGLMIAAGALIIAGGLVVMAVQDGGEERTGMIAGQMGAGALIVALGAVKLRR